MIFLATDHAGFEMKEKIKLYLENEGIPYEDMGAHSFDRKDDYPDFILPTAEKVAASPENRGIILGGSGQGEAIAANKVKGIRATVYHGRNLDIVKLSRTHNNGNVLSLGARFLTEKEAIEAVQIWLSTQYSDKDRHNRRLGKISAYEK